MAIPAKWATLAAQVEAAAAPHLADLATRQATYYGIHGAYWQGVDADIPKQGNSRNRQLAQHPTDQASTWADLGWTLPRNVPFAVSVDVYSGPMGDGYTVSALADLDGRIWRRVWSGTPDPENRAMDWYDVTPETP